VPPWTNQEETTMGTMNGSWNQVSETTAIYLDAGGQPIVIATSGRDLDAASDDAAEFFGGPLGLSEWDVDNSRLAVTGRCPARLSSGPEDIYFADVVSYAVEGEDLARDVILPKALRSAGGSR
jgi:hypothetical protein